MSTHHRYSVVLLAMLSLSSTGLPALSVCPAAAAAQPAMSEADKIEALIRRIAGLTDAVFIRNGSEHDGKSAADHLRRKWNAKRRNIKSARDFVVFLASKSSISGKPYMIRWKNGQAQTSESFLMGELGKLEQPPAPAH